MGVLISAIIPVYNAEKYLVECIESLRNQTLKDIEMIFINDGSKDKSLEILNKYARLDSRIKVINQKNQGPSSARNKGIKIASGKYLSFIDADDWIDKNMYKEMYKICEDFNVDIIASDTINYVSKFEYSYTKELDIDSGIYTKDEIFRKILPRLFYCCSFNSMWNKIFKKEIVIKNNIMLDEKLYYAEDWKFIVEFLKYTESLAYIDKAYYYYRRGYESLSCKYKDNTFEHNGITLYNNRKLYAKYFGVNTNLGERDLYNTFVHCVISEVRRKDINIRNKIINIKKMLDYKELEYSACCLKKERLKIKEKLNLKLIEKKNVFGIYFYGIIAILLDSIRKKLI